MDRRCYGRTIACKAHLVPNSIGTCAFRTHSLSSARATATPSIPIPTGLSGYLRERGLTRVFLAGLAFDYCVRYSGEDARREGFRVVAIEDACRAIDLDDTAAATRARFSALGVACIKSASIL